MDKAYLFTIYYTRQEPLISTCALIVASSVTRNQVLFPFQSSHDTQAIKIKALIITLTQNKLHVSDDRVIF